MAKVLLQAEVAERHQAEDGPAVVRLRPPAPGEVEPFAEEPGREHVGKLMRSLDFAITDPATAMSLRPGRRVKITVEVERDDDATGDR